MKYFLLSAIMYLLTFLPLYGIMHTIDTAPSLPKVEYTFSKYQYYAGPEEQWFEQYGSCPAVHCLVQLK